LAGADAHLIEKWEDIDGRSVCEHRLMVGDANRIEKSTSRKHGAQGIRLLQVVYLSNDHLIWGVTLKWFSTLVKFRSWFIHKVVSSTVLMPFTMMARKGVNYHGFPVSLSGMLRKVIAYRRHLWHTAIIRKRQSRIRGTTAKTYERHN
jgi:hypothetical protein